ncbi:MAG: M28 family peptidase [Actinobacteria bacterium]|nr:M28 family peptidase [Actinomycetota bacterium]
MATPLVRRRPRRGSLDRPVSTRIYRAAWMLVSVPLLVGALTVGHPEPLPPPRLDPTFDATVAAGLASELTRRFPDRSPGTRAGAGAADWVAQRLREYGLKPERQRFSAEITGRGQVELENLVAASPGRSPQAIVVMAHRDNLGSFPGANDNGSGTATLLELARSVQAAPPPAHTVVFLFSDGGAHGGVGAAEFARDPALVKRLVGRGAEIVAVVNLDSVASGAQPRLVFAGDAARSPATTLVATADRSVLAHTGSPPLRPSAAAQLLDLAFPFTLHEQGPFVARRTPAITITTGADRAPPPERDTLENLNEDQLGALGRAAHALVSSLDAAAAVARGTESYLLFDSWYARGWTIKFALLVALLPFLAATVDLFARCRRRHIALRPALRGLASRLGVWTWIGAVFALFAVTGLLADGAARPINPGSEAAQDWPVVALLALGALSLGGWLVVRPRLVPRGRIERHDELAGHLAAMLVLAVVALVVAAINPYALIFVLPSLHAWLWLPHVEARTPARVALYAVGFAGPVALVASFAFRFGLGGDALWYMTALASVGYVPAVLVAVTLAWCAVAGQVGAIAVGRYAPYPAANERPARGPVREGIRRVVLFSRERRARSSSTEPETELRSLGD